MSFLLLKAFKQIMNIYASDVMDGIPVLNGRLDWETTKVFF